jgi:hypothetical protein
VREPPTTHWRLETGKKYFWAPCAKRRGHVTIVRLARVGHIALGSGASAKGLRQQGHSGNFRGRLAFFEVAEREQLAVQPARSCCTLATASAWDCL